MNRQDAYIQKFEAQLDAWKADINKLRARADDASAEAKLDLLDQLDRLRARRDDARDQLDELRKAGEDNWEQLKTRSEQAWADLSSGIKDALERFRT
ncbi:hypothetical protein JN531_001865 [Flagellatimonas centrodinii]|uniref:hypothetical protein n=1 Tax=Flagellatimonas centrodinii TaxID=2806210 RepID=UPI001FED461E|nr:hypothetical protein [Flagellatimonas centrodinii]ULQ47042.1 hypothetical protein JN531_001865 [Flagellatimonas centrodinii]